MSDNVIEAPPKNARVPVRGEKHGRSRLTDDQVVAIRERYYSKERPTLTTLALEYDVSISTVSYAIKKGWTHLPR